MTIQKKHILIVEDERPLSSALADRLSREGFQVTEAADGELGLERALADKPAMILLDLMLPKRDGLSILEALRSDSWGKNVPVIMLTNSSDLEKITKALQNKANDYMVKADWKLEEIVEKVKQELHK